MLVSSAHAATPPDFEREIKAIFKERCVACHGPLKQKAGLRLDAGAMITRGSEHGPVVVPAKSSDSVMVRRITVGSPGTELEFAL